MASVLDLSSSVEARKPRVLPILSPAPIPRQTVEAPPAPQPATVGGRPALPRPAPSVYAFFFNPSVSYVISEQWNASFSMPTTRRWFDTINGVTQRNLTWEPTGVVEYVILAGRGGRSANAGQSRHRLCRWGREKLVEPINSRLYPMASRSRLQDGVAILDQRVELWIAKAGAYFGDRCVSC